MDGKLVRALTRGEWEVTELAGVDEAAKTVYYVSTAQSPLERQLDRVGFNGKHPARLSRTPGTHTITMSPDCEYYLDSESSLTAPAHAACQGRQADSRVHGSRPHGNR